MIECLPNHCDTCINQKNEIIIDTLKKDGIIQMVNWWIEKIIKIIK